MGRDYVDGEGAPTVFFRYAVFHPQKSLHSHEFLALIDFNYTNQGPLKEFQTTGATFHF